MRELKEYYSGNSGKAFFLTCIGKRFAKVVKKIFLPFFLNYCKKHDIGLIIVEDYIDKNSFSYPNLKDPGIQRLLAPKEILKKFKKYKYLCDIDTDCLPGFLAEDIFKYASNKIKKNQIFVVKPYPEGYLKKNLGKRVSLLRKTYIDKSYPLDSLFIASDDEEGKLLKYRFEGPWPTIGTCIGRTDTLAKTGSKIYSEIKKDKNFKYLQSFRIDYYKKNLNIKWLKYEFQAIWNYEVALNYPFLFHKKFKKLYKDCVIATLFRVQFLHFAGSWPENWIFNKTKFKQSNLLIKYYKNLESYLLQNTKARLYGKINYKRKIPS